jgi:two-component system chemotaxis response regulator CheB
MGSDGAEGLKQMRAAGSWTLGQDERTCTTYGMPKVAFDLGAVVRQAPLEEIGPLLELIVNR